MRGFALINLIGLAIFFSACKTSSTAPAEEKPSSFNYDSFKITTYKDGGMLPESENLIISPETSHWIYRRYSKETKVSWTSSPEELRELYSFLQKHNYSKITSKSEGEVFDRGGLSITIQNGESEVKIDDSGNNFIEAKWSKDYKKIKQRLADFVNHKVYASKLSISIETSSAMREAAELYEINVYSDGELGFDTEDEQTGTSPIFKAFDGWNKIEIRTFYKDSLGPYNRKVSYQQEQIFLEASKTSQTLKLDFVDGKFTAAFKD
jgi:hypothetical protein